MLNLNDYKIIFATAGLIIVLLIASPTLSLLIAMPGGERFSELWVLGPDHMAEDYAINITAGEMHLVYVRVGNHMGSSTYYTVYVKFRNQTEPLPNATAGTPSPLQPLYEYRIFLQDGEYWETPLTFSVSGVTFSDNQSWVKNLTLNGVDFGVDKQVVYDVDYKGYFYQLFIELWIYNSETDQTEFHNRFVDLWLNTTGSF